MLQWFVNFTYVMEFSEVNKNSSPFRENSIDAIAIFGIGNTIASLRSHSSDMCLRGNFLYIVRIYTI